MIFDFVDFHVYSTMNFVTSNDVNKITIKGLKHRPIFTTLEINLSSHVSRKCTFIIVKAKKA
jgi:hypothetical protein